MPDSNVIRFELTASGSTVGGEGYSLVSSASRIVISAADSRGLFYGRLEAGPCGKLIYTRH